MSQKTNPLSLRLQKTSRNFAYPWFADFFWTEIYLKNFEIEKYIAPFLKQTQYSKAFFSVKNFYRKVSIFIFLHDSRLGKKKNQLLLKKKASTLSLEKRSSNMIALLSQKMISNFFWINSNISSSSPSLSKIVEKKRPKLLFRNCFTFSETTIFPLKKKKDHVQIENLHKGKEKKANLSLSRTTPTVQIEESPLRIRSLFQLNMSPKIVKKSPFSFGSNKKPSVFFPEPERILVLPPALLMQMKNLEAISLSSQGISEALLKRLHAKVHQSSKRVIGPKISLTNFNTHIGMSEKDIEGNTFGPYKEANFSDFFPMNINLQPIRFINYHQNVIALTDQVVDLLEKRITFRQIKYLLFNNILQNNYIKGIRISCSGRLGGRSKKAQKAKLQSDSIGRTPLASFSSKISFHSKSAYTPYGKIGVKIWLSLKDNRYYNNTK